MSLYQTGFAMRMRLSNRRLRSSNVSSIWQTILRSRSDYTHTGRDLEASMSRYLVDRVSGLSNVEVLAQTQVSGMEGEGGVIEAVRWRRGASAEVRRPILVTCFSSLERTPTRLGSPAPA
jgi:hypothetical protein